MNQGTAASQRSMEITLVRQQIDAQAEALRFMHDSYIAVYQPNITFNLNQTPTSPAEEWYEMSSSIETAYNQGRVRAASDFNVNGQLCPTPPTDSFVIDPSNVNYISSSASMQQTATAYPFPQIAYNSDGTFLSAYGIWIEPVRSDDIPGENNGFIDFHIRACWQSLGLPVASTQGTIVRLYEPRG